MLYIKLVWMYMIAIFTALFVYPLLHESGHFLAGLLMGADIIEMSVFPMPYVSMLVDPFDPFEHSVIGMCGMIFPMVCIVFRPRHFVSSIVVGTIAFVNALAWLLGCVALVADHLGFCWKNEDVITVIHSMEGVETGAFCFCVAVLIVSFCALFSRNYVQRILSFF